MENEVDHVHSRQQRELAIRWTSLGGNRFPFEKSEKWLWRQGKVLPPLAASALRIPVSSCTDGKDWIMVDIGLWI
jgi:hypothetical protein